VNVTFRLTPVYHYLSSTFFISSCSSRHFPYFYGFLNQDCVVMVHTMPRRHDGCLELSTGTVERTRR